VQKYTAAKIFAAVKQLLLKTTQTLQQEAFERGLRRPLRLQQVLIKPRETAAVHRRQSEGGLLTLVNIKSDHPP
jgi:hypothetical protein